MKGPGSFLRSEWEQLARVPRQRRQHHLWAPVLVPQLPGTRTPPHPSSPSSLPTWAFQVPQEHVVDSGLALMPIKHARSWPFLQGWNKGLLLLFFFFFQSVVAMPLGAGARLSEFKSSHAHSGKLPNLSGPQFPHL